MIDLKTFASEPFRIYSECLKSDKNRFAGIKMTPSSLTQNRSLLPVELLDSRPDLDSEYDLVDGWHWYERDGSLYYLCRPSDDQCRTFVDLLARQISIKGWETEHNITEAERTALATMMCPFTHGWGERKRSVSHLMNQLGRKLGGRLRRVPKRRSSQ